MRFSRISRPKSHVADSEAPTFDDVIRAFRERKYDAVPYPRSVPLPAFRILFPGNEPLNEITCRWCRNRRTLFLSCVSHAVALREGDGIELFEWGVDFCGSITPLLRRFPSGWLCRGRLCAIERGRVAVRFDLPLPSRAALPGRIERALGDELGILLGQLGFAARCFERCRTLSGELLAHLFEPRAGTA